MTEDEAKTKWCPFVRVRGNSDENDPGSWNRLDATNAKNDTLEFRVGADMTIVRCIGSACMAWRWEKAITNKVEIQRVVQMMQVGSGYHQIDPEFANTEHGYCGLAGKP